MKLSFIVETENELYHYRTPGSKNGVRKYQNPDGSLTPEGYRHYGYNGPRNSNGVPQKPKTGYRSSAYPNIRMSPSSAKAIQMRRMGAYDYVAPGVTRHQQIQKQFDDNRAMTTKYAKAYDTEYRIAKGRASETGPGSLKKSLQGMYGMTKGVKDSTNYHGQYFKPAAATHDMTRGQTVKDVDKAYALDYNNKTHSSYGEYSNGDEARADFKRREREKRDKTVGGWIENRVRDVVGDKNYVKGHSWVKKLIGDVTGKVSEGLNRAGEWINTTANSLKETQSAVISKAKSWIDNFYNMVKTKKMSNSVKKLEKGVPNANARYNERLRKLGPKK